MAVEEVEVSGAPKPEPVVDELDALIAETEAVAQGLDVADVSEGRLGLYISKPSLLVTLPRKPDICFASILKSFLLIN